MKLFDAISKRVVGRGRHEPTEEQAQLERRHAEAVQSLREATAYINGHRAKSLDEVEESIEVADGMMREALKNGGSG